MFTNLASKKAVCFFLCVLLASVSTATDGANTCPGRRGPCFSTEKEFLSLLGLREDVNDAEILPLLDIPEKRIFATALVRYRKISSAVLKLLQIVNDDTIFFPAKVAAAKALCDFGNKEWIGTIKTLVTDPNSKVYFSLKISTAGLLARAGDYSQFGILAKHIHHPKRYICSAVGRALGNFQAKAREEVRYA
jgi:hypothetical protein